ncbi:DUF2268 domain-containing protein [Bacillota bacterium Meth-B3]
MMNINVQDTLRQYRRMLELPRDQRKAYYADEILKPFQPMFDIMQMPVDPDMLGLLPVSTDMDEKCAAMLNALESADAWRQAHAAIQGAGARFAAEGISLPDDVVVGIFLGNPERLAASQGYTGAGSIPGYIQIVIAPNAYNLPRLQACIAHEFHHNVLFHNADWDFMQDVTVGRYIAIEGLAESFAGNLYGADCIGPWITGIGNDDLEKARRIIGKSLSVKGFMAVRPYIFGDHPMMPQEQSIGMPYCGGYAVGYHAVQAYLNKTGASVEFATLLDGDVIMEESGYFEIV